MNVTEGFDRKHARHYYLLLVVLAFASGLMLVAGFFEQSPSGLPKEARILLAALSLLTATASYLVIKQIQYAFPLVGISSIAFAASLWAFGAPTALVLLLAIPAAVLLLACLVLKGRADGIDHPD